MARISFRRFGGFRMLTAAAVLLILGGCYHSDEVVRIGGGGFIPTPGPVDPVDPDPDTTDPVTAAQRSANLVSSDDTAVTLEEGRPGSIVFTVALTASDAAPDDFNPAARFGGFIVRFVIGGDADGDDFDFIATDESGSRIATNRADCRGRICFVTIPEGETSAVVMLTPIDDAAIENSEASTIMLYRDDSYIIGDDSASVVVNIEEPVVRDADGNVVMQEETTDPNLSDEAPEIPAELMPMTDPDDPDATLDPSRVTTGSTETGDALTRSLLDIINGAVEDGFVDPTPQAATPRTVTDDDGNPVTVPVVDDDGNPVTAPVLDDEGNPVMDDDGNPVTEPVTETVTEAPTIAEQDRYFLIDEDDAGDPDEGFIYGGADNAGDFAIIVERVQEAESDRTRPAYFRAMAPEVDFVEAADESLVEATENAFAGHFANLMAQARADEARITAIDAADRTPAQTARLMAAQDLIASPPTPVALLLEQATAVMLSIVAINQGDRTPEQAAQLAAAEEIIATPPTSVVELRATFQAEVDRVEAIDPNSLSNENREDLAAALASISNLLPPLTNLLAQFQADVDRISAIDADARTPAQTARLRAATDVLANPMAILTDLSDQSLGAFFANRQLTNEEQILRGGTQIINGEEVAFQGAYDGLQFGTFIEDVPSDLAEPDGTNARAIQTLRGDSAVLRWIIPDRLKYLRGGELDVQEVVIGGGSYIPQREFVFETRVMGNDVTLTIAFTPSIPEFINRVDLGGDQTAFLSAMQRLTLAIYGDLPRRALSAEDEAELSTLPEVGLTEAEQMEYDDISAMTSPTRTPEQTARLAELSDLLQQIARRDALNLLQQTPETEAEFFTRLGLTPPYARNTGEGDRDYINRIANGLTRLQQLDDADNGRHLTLAEQIEYNAVIGSPDLSPEEQTELDTLAALAAAPRPGISFFLLTQAQTVVDRINAIDVADRTPAEVTELAAAIEIITDATPLTETQITRLNELNGIADNAARLAGLQAIIDDDGRDLTAAEMTELAALQAAIPGYTEALTARRNRIAELRTNIADRAARIAVLEAIDEATRTAEQTTELNRLIEERGMIAMAPGNTLDPRGVYVGEESAELTFLLAQDLLRLSDDGFRRYAALVFNRPQLEGDNRPEFTAFGLETPTAAIPNAGRATYNGAIQGIFYDAVGQHFIVVGNQVMTADFGESEIFGSGRIFAHRFSSAVGGDSPADAAIVTDDELNDAIARMALGDPVGELELRFRDGVIEGNQFEGVVDGLAGDNRFAPAENQPQGVRLLTEQEIDLLIEDGGRSAAAAAIQALVDAYQADLTAGTAPADYLGGGSPRQDLLSAATDTATWSSCSAVSSTCTAGDVILRRADQFAQSTHSFSSGSPPVSADEVTAALPDFRALIAEVTAEVEPLREAFRDIEYLSADNLAGVLASLRNRQGDFSGRFYGTDANEIAGTGNLEGSGGSRLDFGFIGRCLESGEGDLLSCISTAATPQVTAANLEWNLPYLEVEEPLEFRSLPTGVTCPTGSAANTAGNGCVQVEVTAGDRRPYLGNGLCPAGFSDIGDECSADATIPGDFAVEPTGGTCETGYDFADGFCRRDNPLGGLGTGDDRILLSAENSDGFQGLSVGGDSVMLMPVNGDGLAINFRDSVVIPDGDDDPNNNFLAELFVVAADNLPDKADGTPYAMGDVIPAGTVVEITLVVVDDATIVLNDANPDLEVIGAVQVTMVTLASDVTVSEGITDDGDPATEDPTILQAEILTPLLDSDGNQIENHSLVAKVFSDDGLLEAFGSENVAVIYRQEFSAMGIWFTNWAGYVFPLDSALEDGRRDIAIGVGGQETPMGAVPTSGVAEYAGSVVGNLSQESDGRNFYATGGINLQADFASNEMEGQVDISAYDLQTTFSLPPEFDEEDVAGRLVGNLPPMLIGGVNPAVDAGSDDANFPRNTFRPAQGRTDSGDPVDFGLSVNPNSLAEFRNGTTDGVFAPFSGQVLTRLLGGFYGPNAEEVGGWGIMNAREVTGDVFGPESRLEFGFLGRKVK